MAIPKKGTRRIRVGGRRLRWAVSTAGTRMLVLIERDGAAGQRLAMTVNYEAGRLAVTHAVSPSLVARCVTDGMAAGWRPDHPGPPLAIEVLDGPTPYEV